MSDTRVGSSGNGSNKNEPPINKSSSNGNFGNEVNLSLKKEMETSYLSIGLTSVTPNAFFFK